MPSERGNGCEIGPVHQQRRQEQHQHQFGIEHHHRQSRHERQRPAAYQQRHRWRQADPRRRPMQHMIAVSSTKTNSNVSTDASVPFDLSCRDSASLTRRQRSRDAPSMQAQPFRLAHIAGGRADIPIR